MENIQYYKDFKIYFGLATLVFSSKLEKECIKEWYCNYQTSRRYYNINDKYLKIFKK